MHNCKRFGQLQNVRAAETLQCSHRPDGIFTCFVLAGRRCLHRRWHGDLVIMHHHWQYSLLCACSRSKVPIAPMGKLLTRLPDSRLHNCERFGQQQRVRAAETLKSSHRPNGNFTCFALVLAGRRCFYRQWHGDLLIVHRNWQHSLQCAHAQTSHRPDGKMLTCLP